MCFSCCGYVLCDYVAVSVVGCNRSVRSNNLTEIVVEIDFCGGCRVREVPQHSARGEVYSFAVACFLAVYENLDFAGESYICNSAAVYVNDDGIFRCLCQPRDFDRVAAVLSQLRSRYVDEGRSGCGYVYISVILILRKVVCGSLCVIVCQVLAQRNNVILQGLYVYKRLFVRVLVNNIILRLSYLGSVDCNGVVVICETYLAVHGRAEHQQTLMFR